MDSINNLMGRLRLVRTGDAPTTAPVEPRCARCLDAGFLRIGWDDEGRPRYGECACRVEAHERSTMLARRAKSGLVELDGFTFALFKHGSDLRAGSADRAFTIARDYADDPKGWLCFYGTFGAGKTHLAAAIAAHRLDEGDDVIFRTVPDVLDDFKRSFSPKNDAQYSDLFDQVRTCDLLVLDDFGTQQTTPWASENLFRIVDYRSSRQLPTVITTNLGLDDIDPRLRSRISNRALCKLVKIDGTDQRLKGAR